MAIIVSEKSGGGTPPPPGVHQAVCSKVWDLGMQPGFGGKEQHKVAICWELEARIEEGEYKGHRHLHIQTYTASLNENARLRQDLEAWRGAPFTGEQLAGFDVEMLVGVNCQMNLVPYTKQNGKQGTKMASIMPPPDSAKRMEPELPSDYMPGFVKDALGRRDDFQDDVPEWPPEKKEQPKGAGIPDNQIPFGEKTDPMDTDENGKVGIF